MRSLWHRMCALFENHSRVLLIVTLLGISMWSCNCIIAESAQPQRSWSCEGALARFVVVALGWWAAFSTSSVPLRVAGWLGGIAPILAVPFHHYVLLPPRGMRWISFLAEVGGSGIHAIVVLAVLLLSRFMLRAIGIRLAHVPCRPCNSGGASQRDWRATGIDTALLGAVLTLLVFALAYTRAHLLLIDGVEQVFLMNPHSGFIGDLLVVAGAGGGSRAILALGVAWCILGQGPLIRKLGVLFITCGAYVAGFTLSCWHVGIAPQLTIGDLLFEVAGLGIMCAALFSVLRLAGYRLARDFAPPGGVLGSKKAPVKTGGE